MIIIRKLIENGNVKLISWGKETQVKGLIDNPTQAHEALVEMSYQNGVTYHITALVQNMIIQTVDKNPPPNLLQYGVKTLTEKLPGYERVSTENFQPRLGGNVEILIGQDLMNLHPTKIAKIHDGFFITQMEARLYNVNHFLGFSGLFPRGLEPNYQIENHPRAVLYANHPQQADHEAEQVFHVAASAHQPP